MMPMLAQAGIPFKYWDLPQLEQKFGEQVERMRDTLQVSKEDRMEFDVGAVFTLEFLLPICGLATLLLVQVMYKKFKKSNGEY